MRIKVTTLISRFILYLNLINHILIISFVAFIVFSCSENNDNHNKVYTVVEKEIDSLSVPNHTIDIPPETSFTKSSNIQKQQSKLDSASVLFIFLYRKNRRKIDDDISVSIKYSDSLYEYSLTNQDFFVGKGYGMPHTIKYATAREGYSTIEFRIDKLGENLSSGKLKIPLRKDWARDIYLQISSEYAMKGCWGWNGYKSFPVLGKFKQSTGDSLNVVWGGNSISSPVIY